MTPARRQPRCTEPEPIGAVLDRLVRDRPWAAGMAVGRLARCWSEVVGERLASESRPLRIDRETLVIEASSAAWGAQIRFLSQEIRSRAASVVPGAQIDDIRVSVEPSRGEVGPRS